MSQDAVQKTDASDWRVAAMRFVGAAARATDRAERTRFLLCASECLDRAEEIVDLPPGSPRPPSSLH